MNAQIDTQYRDLLRFVMDNGEEAVSQQDVNALTYMGPQPLRFKPSVAFPMITERNMNPKTSETLPVTIWEQAVGEIFAFINGAVTQEELARFGCFWWEKWCTPEKCAKRDLPTGHLGPGSYGAAFHNFPTTEGEPFNQFKNLVEQIRELPHLRTHFVSPWIPQYIYRGKGKKQKVVVAPCHGWIHVRVINGKLSLVLFQRSADLVIGVPSNMIQYSALLLALARVTSLEPHEFVHMMSDAHIYVNQLDVVEKMLEREPRPLPQITLTKNTGDIFAFRREDFTLSNYNPHPGIKAIKVAI